MRYTIFLAVILGSAATAIAAMAPAHGVTETNPSHMTIVEKNQAFPLIGPLVFDDCSTDDCAQAPNRI